MTEVRKGKGTETCISLTQHVLQEQSVGVNPWSLNRSSVGLAASFRSRKTARTQLAHTKAWAPGGKPASLQRRRWSENGVAVERQSPSVRNRAIHEYVEPDQTTQSSGCIRHILQRTQRGFDSLQPRCTRVPKNGQAADESQHLVLRESWSCLALAGIAKHSTIHQARS